VNIDHRSVVLAKKYLANYLSISITHSMPNLLFYTLHIAVIKARRGNITEIF